MQSNTLYSFKYGINFKFESYNILWSAIVGLTEVMNVLSHFPSFLVPSINSFVLVLAPCQGHYFRFNNMISNFESSLLCSFFHNFVFLFFTYLFFYRSFRISFIGIALNVDIYLGSWHLYNTCVQGHDICLHIIKPDCMFLNKVLHSCRYSQFIRFILRHNFVFF